MTAVPGARFRDQLAEITGCAPLADSGGAVWCETHGEDWPCKVGRIEAVVEAGVQVADEDAVERAAQAVEALRPHIPPSTDPNRRTSVIVRSTLNRAARAVRAAPLGQPASGGEER